MARADTDDVDLIAGGPSCQGFSTHGKRIEDDPRNFLFKEFVRIVGEVRPKYFLMENVKGLLAYSKGYFKNLIEDSFGAIGYRVTASMLCAADYGVPQLRHRVVFLGTRIDNAPLTFPVPTHGPDRRRPYVTVQEAIGDLPLIEGDFERTEWDYVSRPLSAFQRYARAGARGLVTLHQSHALSPQAARIARYVKQGLGLRSVPSHVMPDRFKKMRRISNGNLRKDCTTLYFRLSLDRPSYTITTHYRNVASGPFLHPWEDRPISHREAARFMSFPDRFVFGGAGIPRQIGNAVPPLLAEAVANAVLRMLEHTSDGSTGIR
jgi:DNA (cytosine-5)-methyltransferase 1